MGASTSFAGGGWPTAGPKNFAGAKFVIGPEAPTLPGRIFFATAGSKGPETFMVSGGSLNFEKFSIRTAAEILKDAKHRHGAWPHRISMIRYDIVRNMKFLYDIDRRRRPCPGAFFPSPFSTVLHGEI
jgi:hypothetical protein